MTQEQIIEYLVKLPLKELRERQCLIDEQMETAYSTGNITAFEKLQQWREDTDSAIMIKEFGR